jgi:hypothetical protein
MSADLAAFVDSNVLVYAVSDEEPGLWWDYRREPLPGTSPLKSLLGIGSVA